jgi:hypothetical protein
VVPSSAVCTVLHAFSALSEAAWCMALASALNPSVMSRRRSTMSPSV